MHPPFRGLAWMLDIAVFRPFRSLLGMPGIAPSFALSLLVACCCIFDWYMVGELLLFVLSRPLLRFVLRFGRLFLGFIGVIFWFAGRPLLCYTDGWACMLVSWHLERFRQCGF